MLYNNVYELIGDTPLLKIPNEFHGFKKVNIYAKLEYFNPFGSVKDRTAYGMIKDNLQDIKDGNKTIIESSSGNTAKALSSFAGILSTDFYTISNRIKVKEQKQILNLLNATVEQVPGKSACPDPSNPNDPLKLIEEKILGQKDHYFYTDQYKNNENLNIHYHTTGPEIYKDLKKIDYFFAGLGTTGSSRGPGSFLLEKNKNLKTVGVVSMPEDFIPGIRTSEEMWEVGLYDKNFYHTVEEVSSLVSLDYMRQLLIQTGINGGPTTGATYTAIIQYLEKNYDSIEEGTNIVFIACDRYEPYLSYIEKRKPEFLGEGKRDYCAIHVDKKLINTINTIESENLNIQNYNQILIDTRSNISFKNMHIENSINIPLEKLYDLIDDNNFPFSKSLHIILICPFGKKTKQAAAFLYQKGYKVSILKGGFESWLDSEREISSI